MSVRLRFVAEFYKRIARRPLDVGSGRDHPCRVTVLRANDAVETAAFGQRLGAALFEGAVVLLRGGLGAGKTCFAQGVARGLGVAGTVPSPTYILVAEYPDARVPLGHVDLYRIERPDEVAALGLEERVGRDGAWIVEWPERAEELWPADHLDVSIVGGGATRALRVHATGPHHAPLEALFGAGHG